MITIFASTNRADSKTNIFAEQYLAAFRTLTDEKVELIQLDKINPDFYHSAMYSPDNQSAELASIQDQFIIPSNKFFFVIPEYNGGCPGVLKLFIDALSVRNKDATFTGKKAGMVGISSGRAGNLRGLEHLTGILNYLGVTVDPNKIHYSLISQLLDDSNNIKDETCLNTIKDQAEKFLAFCK